MKRLIVFTGPAARPVALAQPAAQQSSTVLLVMRVAEAPETVAGDWPVTNRAGVMRDTLEKAGYRVDLASPIGERWGTPGHMLKVDKKLRDIKVADYKAIVIPCLAVDSTALHPDLYAVIRAAGS